MFLGRLRIRGKLAAVVTLPVVVVLVLATMLGIDQLDRARRAGAVVSSVQVATQVGSVVADLQREELISVGYLLGADDQAGLTLQEAIVGDRIADLRTEFGADLPDRIADALDSVQPRLDPLRKAIEGRTAQLTDVVPAFAAVIGPVIDSLRLATDVDTTTAAGREVIALDALLRIDELDTEGAADLLIAVSRNTDATIVTYSATQKAADALAGRFEAYASPAQVQLYDLVAGAYLKRVGDQFAANFSATPHQAISKLAADALYPQLASYIGLGRFVETKIAADVTADVARQEQHYLVLAYVTAGVALLVLLLVTALSVLVVRSVVRSLTRLTASAERASRVTRAELERIADDESERLTPVALDRVELGGTDEIGDLARAFDRLQQTAAALAERQATSRRNVATMFGHVGRRTQNLVGRQLAIIDSLEYGESDPRRLDELYRLDHVTSRLRRNAGSLVVLSGAFDEGRYTAPMALHDIVRLALGEIEDYPRVDVFVPAATMVEPAVINDLVLILAELMENASAFSPPNTRVRVIATAYDSRVTVIDGGIGMTDVQLAAENARLAQRERLDLAPTGMLGLFVVGRLARRHQLIIQLEPTPGGGLTVVVDLGKYASMVTPAAAQAVRALDRPAIPAPRRAEPAPLPDVARPQPQPVPAARGITDEELAAGGTIRAVAPVPRASQALPGMPAAPPPAWPPMPALDSRPFDIAQVQRAADVLSSGAPWNAFEVLPAALTDVPALPAGPYRPEPAAGNGVEPWLGDDSDPLALVRRIPGATTPPGESGAFVASWTALDPEEARALVEQFETGVSQALAEVEADDRSEEGSMQ